MILEAVFGAVGCAVGWVMSSHMSSEARRTTELRTFECVDAEVRRDLEYYKNLSESLRRDVTYYRQKYDAK